MRKKLPYHLGLIIPCTIIIVNGSTSFWSTIFYDTESTRNVYLIAYSLVWISYAMAIFTEPGYTDGLICEGASYVQCLKCKLPKPERAHHCRVCGRCVLRMDHHCPWTENCVGFKNMPHFVRFITSAAILSGYSAYRSTRFLLYVLSNRKFISRMLPNYTRIWLAGISLIGNVIIVLTLTVLWIRVMIDTAQGQTQIENWEQERVRVLHRKKMAPLTEFPFDIGLATNIVSALGQPFSWFLPWSVPDGNGHKFSKLFQSERWPPLEPLAVHKHDYYRADRWVSYDGESLTDFGVDKTDFEIPQASEYEKVGRETTSCLVKPGDDDNLPLSSFKYRPKNHGFT